MKKFLTVLLGIVFLLTTFAPDAFGQTRRKKKRFAGLPTNAAIVGGSTVAGALIGGKKGAAIGAGGGLLYAANRKGTKRQYRNSKYRRVANVAGGSLLGGGIGAAVGGKKGAIIGAGAGGVGTYVVTRKKRRY